MYFTINISWWEKLNRNRLRPVFYNSSVFFRSPYENLISYRTRIVSSVQSDGAQLVIFKWYIYQRREIHITTVYSDRVIYNTIIAVSYRLHVQFVVQPTCVCIYDARAHAPKERDRVRCGVLGGDIAWACRILFAGVVDCVDALHWTGGRGANVKCFQLSAIVGKLFLIRLHATTIYIYNDICSICHTVLPVPSPQFVSATSRLTFLYTDTY